MTISTVLAENLRRGIIEGKLDAAAGPDHYEHEPALAFLPDPMSGGVVFNRAEEKAYRHVRATRLNTA